MPYLIRPATPQDAVAISRVVINALHQSNAQDYSAEIIAQVARNFSPEAILQRLAQRQVFVAIGAGQVMATASLDQDVVRSVFVEPSQQGLGIGKQLMAHLQRMALDQGCDRLRVPSSLTAQGFYAALGYDVVRDEFHGAERTIIMEKLLLR